MMKEKSQTAIEFLIVVGFVLGMFTILFLSIQESNKSRIIEKNINDVKQVALIVQEEINFAASSTDGYERTFSLPPKINGMNYDITLVKNGLGNAYDYIQIKAGSGDGHSMGMPIEKIENTSTINIGGDNIIKKDNGKITLN
jgi:hypothetical protein